MSTSNTGKAAAQNTTQGFIIWGRRVLSGLVFWLTLALACLPPALVVMNRWFFLFNDDVARETWCRVDFFCKLFWPSYFLYILIATLLLLVLLFFQRRLAVAIHEQPLAPIAFGKISLLQSRIGLLLFIAAGIGMALVIFRSLTGERLPGWDLVLTWLLFMVAAALRSVPLQAITSAWREQGAVGLALAWAHLSLVGVLASYYAASNLFYFAVLGLLFSLVNLWHFRARIPRIFWVMSLALLAYTYNINAWWTAVIGDDLNFHELAWRMAEQVTFSELGQLLFNAGGAHGSHTFLSSFLQAISMKFFGHGSFGWRFSNLYLLSWGILFYYFFLKSFIEERIAILAVFFLAFSLYIISFGKIGYNNLQALFALLFVFAATAWALRSKSELSFAVLGSGLALCLYVYPAALYILPLPLLLLAMHEFPLSWPVIKRWLLMLAVPAALSFPLFLQPIYWDTKQQGTFTNQPALMELPNLIRHFASNLLYSFYSFVYVHDGTHYLVYSYLDPLSAVFLLLGFILLLYQARRQRFAIFMLLAYLFFLFTVGASHDRRLPPTTRMFLLLPWFVLFTAWGLRWVTQRFEKSWPRAAILFQAIILLCVAALNLYQGNRQSYAHFASRHQIETLFLRVAENIYKADPDRPKNYTFLLDQDWSEEGLRIYLHLYPYMARAQYSRVRLDIPEIPTHYWLKLAERDTVVIISPFMNPDHSAWPGLLGKQLERLGKVRCEVRSPDGANFRFLLYHSPDLPQACPTPDPTLVR